MGRRRNRNRLLGLLVVLGLLLVFGLLLSKYPLSSVPGYTSAYQGAHPRFYAIVVGQDHIGHLPGSSEEVTYNRGSYFTEDGEYLVRINGVSYTGQEALDKIGTLDFSITELTFDLDHPLEILPNIEAEMTDIVVPRESVANILSLEHLPREWLVVDLSSDVRNPVNTWDWTVENQDGSIDYIVMTEWVLYWYVSFEAVEDSHGHQWWNPAAESDNRRYHNLEIWFRIDLNKDNWYFEGQPDQVYFAIAKIQLLHIDVKGHEPERIDVTPESPGSYLPIYLEFMGDGFQGDQLYNNILYYKNRSLNPTYFRDSVYTKIILNDFGTQEWYEPPWNFPSQADVVTFGFKVHVFVIGDWKVQNIDDLKNYEGRKPKIVNTWPSFLDFLEWLGSGLSNPFVLLTMLLIAIVVIFIIILIVAPGLLLGVTSIMSKRG